MSIHAVSLFDVENVEEMPKVRDMTVEPVATSDVREFSRRYHYTNQPGNAAWRWGLWHGAVLHGVVAYNIPTRTLCESIFGKEHADNIWHMSRLMLADSTPRNGESRLIGGSLKAIEREHRHVWAVLTYAATDAGHIGTVYQATNALYTGTGGDGVYYVDQDGRTRSTYQTLGLAHKRVGHVSVADALARGWTVHKSGPKHRYLYILGNKAERRARRKLLKLPVLPYPKKEAAA